MSRCRIDEQDAIDGWLAAQEALAAEDPTCRGCGRFMCLCPNVCATCGGAAIEGTDACLTCLVAACIEFGCGAFIGSVEGGEASS